MKLLTVGRLENQKGIDLAIEACKRLADEGHNIAWYVIGDGSERAKYQEMIDSNGLGERFVLLGRKDNPFPYMKACDYYIQPSRHEGYCLTVLEAKVLNKTIICTDFAGAREQIENNVTGYIVNSISAEKIAETIYSVISNPQNINHNLCDDVKNSNSQSASQLISLLAKQ